MVTTFEDLQRMARLIVEGAIAFSLEDFVKKVEEWVESQPEQLKNSVIGYFGLGSARAVKRADLPKVLREDPDFRERFIRFLAGKV